MPVMAVMLIALAVGVVPGAWFRALRRPHGYGEELGAYRSQLSEHHARIQAVLSGLAEAIDGLRRRDIDVDLAAERLVTAEQALDAEAEQMRDMLAPQELHGLHAEYEANLERALRGIVTAERGCGLSRQPHRPPDDEEAITYWKRGHANLVNAAMRMSELAEALLSWAPGKPADASLAARLHRD